MADSAWGKNNSRLNEARKVSPGESIVQGRGEPLIPNQYVFHSMAKGRHSYRTVGRRKKIQIAA